MSESDPLKKGQVIPPPPPTAGDLISEAGEQAAELVEDMEGAITRGPFEIGAKLLRKATKNPRRP